MQIGATSVSTLPVPASYRRDELAERRQQQQTDQAAAAQQQSQQTGEVTRIRPRASVAAQRADTEASQYTDNLPPRGRSAVAAYTSNGPSIEERLGVELAGVDVYA